jgi:hypothetical protein
VPPKDTFHAAQRLRDRRKVRRSLPVEDTKPCGQGDHKSMTGSASRKGEHTACCDAGHSEEGWKQNCMMLRLGDLNRPHIQFALVARVLDSSVDKSNKARNDQDDSEWFHC